MTDYRREVEKKLIDEGCYFVRHGKGDHDIYRSPITNRNITLDSKILSRHTANGILKDAGIEEKV